MKKFAIVGFAVALMGGGALRAQQSAPPQKEHEWLQQLAGEWDYDTEVTVEPGKPPVKVKGTENVRMLGGFWVIAEHKATLFDTPFNGILTLGFDSQKKKYVGTWFDSMHGHILLYEGSADGKNLTVFTEGPNPAAPGKLCKFKEVIEIKSKDDKVLTSSMQGEDGKWVEFMKVNYRRKK